MCGILGITKITNLDIINDSLKSISHRGPDNNQIFSDNKIALAHTRLSIQDLSSSGDQPMISEDGNFIIIYNGEIYNHFEIRKAHLSKYNFKSTSDTETLLYGFIEFGKEILNKINGIFSFAIYNKVTGDVFIARDPYGVKPLYYYHHKDTFLFASEIKPFIEFPSFEKSLNAPSLLNYCTLLYSPGINTPFTNVKRLLPGYYIEFNVYKPRELSLSKYYEIPLENHNQKFSEKELLKDLENILFKAIDRQMLSDVPVGFFLSGGLDSSAIVALTKAIYPERKLQCFTASTIETLNSEGIQDDLPYARLVAKHLNVSLEVITGDFNTLNNFDFMVYHLDEPIADPASLHVYNISKRAKELDYKVLISGVGADEIFSGYRRHQAMRIEKIYPYAPSFFFQFLSYCVSFLNASHPLRRRVDKLFKNVGKGKYERMASYFLWLDLEIGRNLFSDNLRHELSFYDPRNYYYDLLKNLNLDTSELNQMLYLDMKTYLPDNNLLYTDKMGMAAGVEIRVPFLDKELVEFSSRFPSDLKMKGTSTKYLLRKLMKKYLPDEIINRPKTGFGAPVRSWITGDLESKIQTDLSRQKIIERGIFNPDKVWELINNNKSGKIDASYPIWALLAIESWFRQFTDIKK